MRKWDLGTEKGWAKPAIKNKVEYVEMDDGNKEDWEDQEWRNKSKGRCDKHKWENKRSETEMVRPCGEKDRRCSNENMEWGESGHRNIGRLILRCYKKRHEGGRSQGRRNTRQENVKFENSMRRSHIGKRPKNKKITAELYWITQIRDRWIITLIKLK